MSTLSELVELNKFIEADEDFTTSAKWTSLISTIQNVLKSAYIANP